MPLLTDDAPALPLDAQGILELAARSMFQLFSSVSQGMFLVDRSGRIVWVNEGYQRFLPDLGFSSVDQFVGRTVEEVIPNTQMRRVLETGQPVLIDLLTNKAGTFVVSRIPLRDDADRVIGAIGIVLFDHPETTLQPLISKFALLQRDLDDARRELASQRRRSLTVAGDGERRSKYTFASFIGSSPAAAEVKRQARRAAQSTSPVLLLGETGTGKELLAHAIHAASSRASGPFVSVNIAAVPDTLLEAEFFGVAPGAYTGASAKGRDGKFKLADGGTLFLDEIGDMPQSLQAKLLRALQEGEIEPLGSNKLVPFWPPPRAIWLAWCVKASSAKTCFTACTCCRCACHHCVRGAVTFRHWSRLWAMTWRCATARHRPSCCPRPWPCSLASPGAATSASCATCWSRP